MEEKLRKLREYDAASSGFFDDISDLETNINTGLSQLQTDVAAFNGSFTIPSKKALNWTKAINTKWEKRTLVMNYVNTYGFDIETAKQIIQVKQGIDKKFPDMSQEERDYLLLRVLGSVSYGAVNGTKEELLWNMTAGSLGDYFYKEKSNASGNSVYREEMTFDEIMAELGLSDEGAKTLYKNLTLQHGLSGDDRDLNAMSESQLRQYAEEISTSYQNDKGIDITVDEVLKEIQNMYQKADFTHQSITMATHLRPSYYPLINDQVEDLAGWEGDTTKNANERDPSIAIDDYLADLDAVNIVNRMDSESGQSYMEAFNAYHKDLEKGKTSREAEFKQNVDVKEVKTTIFSSLIPNGLSGKVAGVDPTTGTIIYAPASEEEKMAYLKDNHEGSYNFIKSLEDEENQFE
ncbi:hypothetical protein DDV21_010080 [Streptococcus chenjunshii]|uniref:Uncharacterized protein n=1 Tax=Streptococcus chenjunshii TaxID=2173853 RepID=A0A346NFH8_9STRE|nr:hypothetical protein DDV21_010080 [Streptococcus chenjunshii]